MTDKGVVPLTHVVSDFQRSKAFYEMLGFQAYWPVPGTDTEEAANAVGMPKYEVDGALMALQNAEQAMFIALLEWKSPRDDSPLYPNLYRPGPARIALSSSNIDTDLDFLVANSVEVATRPVDVHTSENSYARFFCFKDPDGTFLELVQMITTQ